MKFYEVACLVFKNKNNLNTFFRTIDNGLILKPSYVPTEFSQRLVKTTEQSIDALWI